MCPSLSSTTPLPMPPLPADWTAIVTNDGSIFAAAAATVPSSVGLCGAAPLVTLTGEPVPSLTESVRTYAGPSTQHGRNRRGGNEARQLGVSAAPRLSSEQDRCSAEEHPPERESQLRCSRRTGHSAG